MRFYKKILTQCKKKERTSPLQAIRAKCLDCMCYQGNEVEKCPCEDCTLWYFRTGQNKSGLRVTTSKSRAVFAQEADTKPPKQIKTPKGHRSTTIKK